jgi:hypothetical protein
MKKIITLLLFFIYLISNAQYVTVRKPLRIVYDNDTLDIYFDTDTVNFHSNLNFHKFENGAIIADSIFVNGNWYKDFKIDSSSVTYSLDTLFLYEDKTYITKDPTTNFGIKLRSDWGGAFDSSVINFKLSNSFVGIQDKNNNYIQFDNSGITFTRGGSYTYDGTYFRSNLDTLADRDWVRNNAGGGDVYKVGTPVDNQLGIWTGDGTIEGVKIEFDGTNFELDTIHELRFKNNPKYFNIYQPNYYSFRFGYNGSDIFDMRSTGFGGMNNDEPVLLLGGTTSTSPSLCPRRDDTNTGIGNAGSDQLSLIAGGSEGLRLETQAITVYDTIYGHYISCTDQPNWAVWDSLTGALTNDSTSDAGFGLTMEIPETIEEFMKDRYRNELAYYYEDNNGKIQKVYTLKGTGPGKTIQKLASRDEIIMRYVEKLEQQNKDLLERVEILEEKLKHGYKTKERKTYWYDKKEDKIKRNGRDE